MSDEKNNQENATPERRKPRRPSQMAQEETKTPPAADASAENTGERRKPRRPSREGQSSEPKGEGEERKPRRPSRAAASADAPAEGGERKPRRSSSSSRSGSRKKKKDQMPIGLAVLAGILLFALYLNTKSGELAMYWIIGNCFGFILRRASFCFTASMRDPYLTGSTTITRAVLIAFAITSIGFTAIKYGYFRMGLPIPGMSYVVPISVATAVGAFIFGIGMVIAGGCASGTLMRVGEGFHMQVLSLFFFIVGSLWGAHDMGFWKRNFMLAGKKVFLPDVFGWFGGIVLNLLIIAVLYVAAEKWENRKGAAGH